MEKKASAKIMYMVGRNGYLFKEEIPTFKKHVTIGAAQPP